MKPKILSFLLVLSAAFCGAFAGETVALVKDGKPQAVILVPKDADSTVKLAAKELADYVEKITGARLSTAETAQPGKLSVRFSLAGEKGNPFPPALEKALKQIQFDGFAVEADRSGVRIVSFKKRGLLYGTYFLLREYGGVIWFHPDPTDEGEYVPKSRDFTVPVQVTVKNPVFQSRKFILNGGSLKNDHVYQWFLRNGIQLHTGFTQNEKYLALDPVFKEGGHDMGNLLVGYGPNYPARMKALMKEHPEYFGLVGGKRLPAGNENGCCQPCTGNPEVLRRMGDNALAQIERFGDLENVRGLCNDDHTVWCECPDCKKLDDPDAPRSNRHANRWWHFVNSMAGRILNEKHPNRKLETLVYQTYRFPPGKVKPDPRVPVVICPHQRCYIHSLTDPNCAPNASTFKEMFDSWHRAGMKATTFEYHTQLPGATRYLPLERAWIDDLKYYRKLNMNGYGLVTRAALSNFGKRSSPFNDHMWMSLWQMHWLTAYYSWNIDADFNKISEEINSKYYGPAWKFMKPYREELTKALYAPKVHMGYGTPDAVLGKCYESAGLAERLRGYLDQAEKAVANDPLYLKRVRRDRLFLQLSWDGAHKLYMQSRQKEYNAKRLRGTVRIDGRLDEDIWRTSDVVSDFKTGVNAPVPASPKTFARIAYDDNALYFGIEAMKAKSGKTDDSASGDGIPAAMKGSHLEIFLTAPSMNGKYYHFGLSHNGKIFQAMTDSPSTRDENVKIDFEYKIVDAPDRWTAEIKAPVAKLSRKISDGETWKINIARSAVTDDGKMETSSWSTGIFHGSSMHRTVAFGEAGALLKNGDFEDVAKPVIKKHLKKQWDYVSGTVPLHWAFNENNTGKVEVRNDNAPSGKNYLRIEGTNAFFGQYRPFPPDVRQISVQMKVRGKGELFTRVFGKQNEGFMTKVDSPDKWTDVTGTIRIPEKPNAFWLRVTGTLDFDDIRVLPVSNDDNMPTAEKHK